MQILAYLLVGAVIFGIIALIDLGLKKLFPQTSTEKTGKSVRLPRYSSIFGVLLTMVAIVALLYVPLGDDLPLFIGSLIVLAMGILLLVNYSRTAIFYDHGQFVYKSLTKKPRTYRYEQITGQKAFLNKSGVNVLLYVGEEEVQLYGAMQGMEDFLLFAFRRWCEENGKDPEEVEHDAGRLAFFPEIN